MSGLKIGHDENVQTRWAFMDVGCYKDWASYVLSVYNLVVMDVFMYVIVLPVSVNASRENIAKYVLIWLLPLLQLW